MIFKFKSKATGDLIMLEAPGRQVLQIIGKDPSAQGIILVAQMPAAVAALDSAIIHEEAARKAQPGQGEDDECKAGSSKDIVSLRARAAPFVQMLKDSMAESADVVWGV